MDQATKTCMHSLSLLPSLVSLALHGGPMSPPSWPAVTAPTESTASSDAPPKPAKMQGRGLAIATGAVGAAALSLGIGRAVMVHKCLDGLADDDTNACRKGGAFTGIRAAQAVTNIGTLGLVLATGIIAGRFDGEAGVRGERKLRKPAAFIGGGAAAIVAGAAIQLAGVIGGVRAFLRPSCLDLDGSGIGHCLARGVTGALVANQVGTSVAQVGVGLLSYGIANRRGADRARRLQQVRIAPNTSMSRRGDTMIGLSISGRF